MEAESQPFLPTPEGDEKERSCWSRIRGAFELTSRNRVLWVVITVLINAFALILIAAWAARRSTSACAATRGKELPGLRLQYVSTQFTDYTQTAYFQEPGSATDAAWENLLSGMFIRVAPEELRMANQSSIELPEDGKQLAWLGVFHDLHCINTLRRWIHHDHYYPDLTPAEWTKFQAHTSHCLDILRQTIQCHADAYLMTFRWTEMERKPVFSPKMPIRTCVDFDLLRESLQPRSVELEEIQRLRNPRMNTTAG